MKFKIDLIKEFLETRGEKVVSSYDVVNNSTVVGTNKSKYKFVGFTTCLKGFKESGMSRDWEDEEMSKAYQDFVIHNTLGNQREHCLYNAIEKNKEYITSKLGKLVSVSIGEDEGDDDDDDFLKSPEELVLKYGGFVKEAVKRYLDLQELDFSRKLDSCRTDDDFKSIVDVSWNLRATHDRYMQDFIQGFLSSYVNRSIDENGEEVFNFEEAEHLVYTLMLEIKEDMDFAFRYQIYRADQRQASINGQAES